MLQDSSFLNELDERIAKPFLMGFSEAMDTVFLVGSGVMVVGFLVMLMLPHVELRKGSSYDDRAKTDVGCRRGRSAGRPRGRPALTGSSTVERTRRPGFSRGGVFSTLDS